MDHSLLYNTFDAIIYRKCGKYSYVNEQEDMIDIFQAMTGLSASAGFVVLAKNNKNAIFVDGRYSLSAKNNVDIDKFDICNYDYSEIMDWIKRSILQNSLIAYDPRFFSHEYIKRIQATLHRYRFECINIENMLNLKPKKREGQFHLVERTFTANKFENLYEAIKQYDLDAYLIADPCTVSWLTNIRDFDSKYTPIVFGYLLVTKNYNAILYVDEMYATACIHPNLHITIKSEKELQEDIKNYRLIGIDEGETPSYLKHNNFINLKNPCFLQKLIKNQTEIDDIKLAAKKDSAAIINFLYWLYNSKAKNITELDIVQKLHFFRSQQEGFIGESFACIAAADEHSSIIHYAPTEQSNVSMESILLLDSGGQYKYGTTDITRTICIKQPTQERKKFYTLVLKGHIALANAKVPVGSSGAQLDPLARQFLWQYFADYPHSTGHGIGYCSHVHEGPIAISRYNNTELRAGMLISNEPAYYKDNEFGVRLENMMLVNKDDGFLTLETISLVPFDINFMDKQLLTHDEITWLNIYHKSIVDIMKNYLSKEVLSWLVSYSFR